MDMPLPPRLSSPGLTFSTSTQNPMALQHNVDSDILGQSHDRQAMPDPSAPSRASSTSSSDDISNSVLMDVEMSAPPIGVDTGLTNSPQPPSDAAAPPSERQPALLPLLPPTSPVPQSSLLSPPPPSISDALQSSLDGRPTFPALSTQTALDLASILDERSPTASHDSSSTPIAVEQSQALASHTPEDPSRSTAPAPDTASNDPSDSDHTSSEPQESNVNANSGPSTRDENQNANEHTHDDHDEGDDDDGDDHDNDNDDDDDDSDDSDDDPYDSKMDFLSHFKEDDSCPTAAELQVLEQGPEKSALDLEHWESCVFTPLDDPEYAAGEAGRITWTIQGFHGTKEKPNRRLVMRSPPVQIGGHSWSLKLFPRGNEGTDQLSVYIECNANEDDDSSQDDMEVEAADSDQPPTEQETSHKHESNAAKAKNTSAENWEVPAQIGCIMYNPSEPRVNVFEKATHRFEPGSRDWGWVRFTGPWMSIHVRQYMQRQALLRHDTLALTAFIRVVHDPTRSLWWRASGCDGWPSLARTGFRGLQASEPGGSAWASALAPWTHLEPFKQLVLGTSVPHVTNEPRSRPRPLFDLLRRGVVALYEPDPDSADWDLGATQCCMQSYNHGIGNTSDVVEVWESLRAVLNREFWGDKTPKHDCLGFLHTIRPAWHPQLPFQSSSFPSAQEPSSVQKILDAAAIPGQTNYRSWQGYAGSGQWPPPVLQIELHRHAYDTTMRRWKKLTHQIRMTDQVRFAGQEYTLFAMIVHKGELDNGQFYSLVRPGDPQQAWIRYQDGEVRCTTKRQAVADHEGQGDCRDESKPVAYIVSYVQSAQVHKIVPGRVSGSNSAACGAFPEKQPSPHEQKNGKVPVVVHPSARFKGHIGLGIPDPWYQNRPANLELEMPWLGTLDDLGYELESRGIVAKAESYRLHPMRVARNYSGSQMQKTWQFDSSPTIQCCIQMTGSAHLWLQPLSTNLDNQAPSKSTSLDRSGDSSAQESGEPWGVWQASTAHSQADAHCDGPAADGEDIVMGGTQADQRIGASAESAEPVGVSDIAASAASAAASWQLPGEPPFHASPDHSSSKSSVLAVPLGSIVFASLNLRSQPSSIILLIKQVDYQAQTVVGLGSFLVDPAGTLKATVEACISPDSVPRQIYCEKDGRLEEKQLSLDATLETQAIVSGTIIVLDTMAMEAANADAMRERGDSPTLPELYQRLLAMTHFSAQRPTLTESYFGGGYRSGPLVGGRLHGPKTIQIDRSPDNFYCGPSRMGMRTGDGGTMYYGNGDTYVGAWVDGKPQGQGTMTYSTTGNEYTGGWQGGRRHGQGVMRYQVADEELQLCRICYEQEMDAVLVRCGHIVACDLCARQVSHCPVCRCPVDSVVKMWRT